MYYVVKFGVLTLASSRDRRERCHYVAILRYVL